MALPISSVQAAQPLTKLLDQMSFTASHSSDSNEAVWTKAWDQTKRSWYLLYKNTVACMRTGWAGKKKYTRRIYVELLNAINPEVTAESFTAYAQLMLEVHPRQPEDDDREFNGKGQVCTEVRWRAALPGQDSLGGLKIKFVPSPAPSEQATRDPRTSQVTESGSCGPPPSGLDSLHSVQDSLFSWGCIWTGRVQVLYLCYQGQPAYTKDSSRHNKIGQRITPEDVVEKLKGGDDNEPIKSKLAKRLKPCDNNPVGYKVCEQAGAIKMKWVGKRGGWQGEPRSNPSKARQTSRSGSQRHGRDLPPVIGKRKRDPRGSPSPGHSGLPLPFAPGFKPHDWVLKAMEDRRDYPGTLGKVTYT